MTAPNVIDAAATIGRDRLRKAMRRGPLLDRQKASREAIQAAATVWAALAGGPSTEHPTVLTLDVETTNAAGDRVRVDIALIATRLPEADRG